MLSYKKITLIAIPLFALSFNVSANSGIEKFWANGAVSLGSTVDCNKRRIFPLKMSSKCSTFTKKNSYKVGDTVNIDGDTVTVGAILVIRYLKDVPPMYGLRHYKAGDMTCSLSTTKNEALKIFDQEYSTKWIQVDSCMPN